jgi:hypothetical protein
MRLAILLFCLVEMACNGAPPKTVSFRLAGTPPDARVTIDDIPMGSLALIAAHGVALPPGQHRVTVEKAGFFPSDRLIEAKEGSGPIKVEVALVPIPE